VAPLDPDPDPDPDPAPDPATVVVVVVLVGGTVVEGTVVVVVDVGTVTGGTFTAGTVVGMVLVVVVVVVVVVGGTVVVVVAAAAGGVVVVVVVVEFGEALPGCPAAPGLDPGAPGAATVMTAVVHAPAFCIVATSSTSRPRARVSAALSDASVVVARETALTASLRCD
jgi:hypothetical protein